MRWFMGIIWILATLGVIILISKTRFAETNWGIDPWGFLTFSLVYIYCLFWFRREQ